MRTAIRGKAEQSRKDHEEKAVRRHARSVARDHKTKTFEDLTAAQKDDLLKELAVRAGLIEDSD